MEQDIIVKQESRCKGKTYEFLSRFGLRTMSFDTTNDNMYVALFEMNDNNVFRFCASKKYVLEHVKRFTPHPETYTTNKLLVASHFKHMAIAWFQKAHLPLDLKEEISRP